MIVWAEIPGGLVTIGLSVGLGLYVVILGAVALHMWRKEAARRQVPIGMDRRMLRVAGQAVQERLLAMDDRLMNEFIGALVAPVLIAIAATVGLGLTRASSVAQIAVLGVSLAGLLISLGIRVRRLKAHLEERRRLRLGMHGEQLVAESLMPLLAKGFHVFHDMPAQGATKPFNLDHVVVGPSGVFVLETKTRSKPMNDGGKADYKVAYDGDLLTWPMGPDVKSCPQARDNAEWLKRWLKTRLGLDLPVIPVVVIPGWWVERTGRGAVTVVNDKQLVHALELKTVLDATTVDLVRRQLDTECRTVKFGVAG